MSHKTSDAGEARKFKAERDAMAKALAKINAAAHKASLPPSERLQDIRLILADVGAAKQP